MATYNQYLENDFRRLGFINYVDMLNQVPTGVREPRLRTHEKMAESDSGSVWNIHFSFSIHQPTESSGKRPSIGNVTTWIEQENKKNPGLEMATVTHFKASPFPTKESMAALVLEKLNVYLQPAADVAKRFRLASVEHPPPALRYSRRT